ncbi:MAG: hypothetical protein WD227_18425 [Vicinamibacterales bacterium]
MDTHSHIDRAPLEHPFGELERELIAAYLAGAGQDLETVMARADPESRELLAQASRYASEKLSEIEARSHYLRSLHGGA